MAKDPYRYFRVEARELLDQIAGGVLELEKGAGGTELPSRLLRGAHTLKGAARVVRQARIAELAHAIEDALAPHRDGTQPAGRDCVDAVLSLIDAITAQLAQLAPPDDARPGGAAPLEPAQPAEPATAMRMSRADTLEVDALLDGLSEIGSEIAGLRRSAASVERARTLAALMNDQLASRRGAASREAAWAKLRSAAEQLQVLMRAAERDLAAGVERADRELRQARDGAERLRLAPAAGLFATLERTARDAAHSVGKRVDFEAGGGDVRLDGRVLDTVQSALVQIVRNAVAHGIEPEAERIAAGKPAAGRVSLAVLRRGYRIHFRCSDDGRGVDLDAVRRAVLRKGSPGPATQGMGAAELLAVLLQGGITTRETVTELSGRGIGLDVVREAVQQLGGEVSAHTSAGAGTAIELRVPVSLASLDVLTIEVDGQLAALPLEAVRRTLRVAPQDVTQGPDGQSILHEGTLIPLRPLSLNGALNGAHNGTRNGQAAAPPRARPAVVLHAAGTIAAVTVDRLLGTETVVLRPLPALAPAEAMVAGMHLDADGNPRMVLAPEVLVSATRHASAAPVGPPAATRPILIVDDSLTTRMLESSILESAGFDVAMAASGEEALDMARNQRYGLFLVDVEMPGMDGFGFIERTRADPQLREVPCILVTSRESADDKRRGQAVGACAHIVKNEFDQAEFLAHVGRLINA